MSQTYGREIPSVHHQRSHRKATRYVVLIGSGGVQIARLFLDSLEQIGELDAGAEEVSSMIRGMPLTDGAVDIRWDRALAGHSAEERRAATVYDLVGTPCAARNGSSMAP